MHNSNAIPNHFTSRPHVQGIFRSQMPTLIINLFTHKFDQNQISKHLQREARIRKVEFLLPKEEDSGQKPNKPKL